MNTLFIICSKDPTENLIRNIESILLVQNISEQDKICVIDSDSKNFDIYTKISKIYPNIDLHFIKNKNYEYGAYKYALDKYPLFKKYFCLQDTIIIKSKINLDLVSDSSSLIIGNENSGFHAHRSVITLGKEILKACNINFAGLNTHFKLAIHCTFIVSNKIINDIFSTLIVPPINKEGSCCYERLFGIYFIYKNINTIDISEHIIKIHGLRQ